MMELTTVAELHLLTIKPPVKPKTVTIDIHYQDENSNAVKGLTDSVITGEQGTEYNIPTPFINGYEYFDCSIPLRGTFDSNQIATVTYRKLPINPLYQVNYCYADTGKVFIKNSIQSCVPGTTGQTVISGARGFFRDYGYEFKYATFYDGETITRFDDINTMNFTFTESSDQELNWYVMKIKQIN